METISIDELKEKLDYSDLRPIRNWCKNNDVLITKHGKREFVYESDFELAYDRPFTNKLKREHGEDWKSVYQLYKDRNVPALNMLHEIPSITFKAYKSANETVNKLQKKLDTYSKNNAA
jgi:hypothetical protein